MSRQIIDEDEASESGLLINTFWGGTERGECVQFTATGRLENLLYTQMKRDDAVKFLELALFKLKDQVEKDKTDPPWWQEDGRIGKEPSGSPSSGSSPTYRSPPEDTSHLPCPEGQTLPSQEGKAR